MGWFFTFVWGLDWFGVRNGWQLRNWTAMLTTWEGWQLFVRLCYSRFLVIEIISIRSFGTFSFSSSTIHDILELIKLMSNRFLHPFLRKWSFIFFLIWFLKYRHKFVLVTFIYSWLGLLITHLSFTRRRRFYQILHKYRLLLLGRTLLSIVLLMWSFTLCPFHLTMIWPSYILTSISNTPINL